LSWLCVLPLFFLVLFLNVRLNLKVQGVCKRIGALQTRAKELSHAVEERRCALNAQTDFSRVEPRARNAGLQAMRGEQLKVLRREAEPEEILLPQDGSQPWLAGVAGVLGPAAAQAEDSHGGESR
jgi:hypothetical protein